VGAREERVARNETLFREVNERIKQVSLTLAEYEAVRSDGTHFAVVTGHILPDVERVIASNRRYAVVAKTDPDAVRIVEAEDPRS
jgi:hypothetical protein